MKKILLLQLVFFWACAASMTYSFQTSDLNFFLEPVICTLPGIHDFICKKYNHPEYKNFLSSCFVHIIDLLEYSRKSCPEPLFVKQIFDIFNQKVKEVHYVNPYALIYFLQNTENLLIDLVQFAEEKAPAAILSDLLTAELSENFNILQNNPQLFIERYAEKAAQTLIYNQERKSYVVMGYFNFVESLIDKVLFDLTEQTEAWNTFIILAQLLEALKIHSIMPCLSMYHKMMWGLIARFIYSLELAPFVLHQDTYQIIVADLKEKKYEFFNDEEIEDLLVKKSDWLLLKLEALLKITPGAPFLMI